jgi:hypothetical protein
MSKASKNVVTPEFRLAFPALFQVAKNRLQPEREGRFEITMLFDKSVDLKALKELAMEAITTKWGTDKAKWPKNLRSPFRDGDEKSDWDGYLGHTFIKAQTQIQPPVFDGACQPILDAKQVFGGCYGKAKVHAYGYDNKGNVGVSFGLDAVQITRRGEPFARSVDAEKEFGKVATSKDDPAAYAGAASDGNDNPFGS